MVQESGVVNNHINNNGIFKPILFLNNGANVFHL